MPGVRILLHYAVDIELDGEVVGVFHVAGERDPWPQRAGAVEGFVRRPVGGKQRAGLGCGAAAEVAGRQIIAHHVAHDIFQRILLRNVPGLATDHDGQLRLPIHLL